MKNVKIFSTALICLLLISFTLSASGATPTTPTPVITPADLYTENDAICTDTYVDGDGDDGDMNFSIYVNSVLKGTCNYAVSTADTKTCTLSHLYFHADDVINCSLTVTDNTTATATGSTVKTVLPAASGTGMLGDSSSGLIGITKDIISLIPSLVDLVIEIVPLIFIFVFIGWLTGLFDSILDMLNLTALKRK